MSRLPNDFALSNLSRRGFLKGVGATGALVNDRRTRLVVEVRAYILMPVESSLGCQ